MSETRKIAAILVADVVGCSRLAGADEDHTLAKADLSTPPSRNRPHRKRAGSRDQGGDAGLPAGVAGKAKATTVSPSLLPRRLWPPAAMTTNCRPPST